MTKTLRLILFTVFMVFVLPTAFAKDAPASAEQLRSELESALKAKNTNAVLALVNWKGVSSTMKTDASEEMGGMISQGAASVKLLPLPTDQQLTNEVDGVRYYPNVQVEGLIDVESTTKGNSSQIPYGESDGTFYIAGVAEETFDANAKKSIFLGVMVMGLFPKETPGILDCSYVYIADGKEKTGSFQCTNNWSEGFRGDYIKSCKVTKISGSGSFKLMVSENAKRVFDSEMTKTNNSISYEKIN